MENLKSGNAFEDRELRRRIDSRRYPNITGELKSMKQTNGSSAYMVGRGPHLSRCHTQLRGHHDGRRGR